MMENPNSKRKIDSVLVLLFGILLVVLVSQYTLFKNNKLNLGSLNIRNREEIRVKEETAKGAVRILVDFGNGRKVEQSLRADTAYKALENLAEVKGFAVTAKQYKYGSMVEEVNGVKNTAEKYWLYSVNGKPGKIAADRYILAPGDTVEWKYSNVK